MMLELFFRGHHRRHTDILRTITSFKGRTVVAELAGKYDKLHGFLLLQETCLEKWFARLLKMHYEIQTE